MHQAGYDHVTILAEKLQTSINNQGTEMLAILQVLAIAENGPSTEDI